jgi:hypothetical protein
MKRWRLFAPLILLSLLLSAPAPAATLTKPDLDALVATAADSALADFNAFLTDAVQTKPGARAQRGRLPEAGAAPRGRPDQHRSRSIETN